jgi:FAD/FMN-containing dehydrogenase
VLLLGALCLVTRPGLHLLTVAFRDVDDLLPLPSGYLDDASRMNAIRVAEVWKIPEKPAEAEKQLAELLARAAQQKLNVSIAGARHTMGGHTLSREGVVIDMLPFNGMSLDEETNILHVGAGARWDEVIVYLDPHDRSVGVMQSNNSFSLGGSLSCNCHGWQFGKPPIASTVESFRIMLADGTIKRCSREENAELFSLALGGYGLFGVILDVDLRVVPNERYRLTQHIVASGEGLAAFDEHVAGREGVAMAYGRLGIVPSRFLEEAILNVFTVDADAGGPLPPLRAAESAKLRRHMFRGSVGSDYGKKLRWSAEVKLQPQLTAQHFSRNQLLNEGVETFQNRSASSTDILHEYFVPRDGLTSFLGEVRKIIPEHGGDLLNVTVRHVTEDKDSLLRYADREMFALVMLFNQATTATADARMEAMTRDLIDAALAAGGRYYLPYRLHATQEQFERAYPQSKRFFELKREYDPGELFQNEFYRRYGD